jgi:seryl-tRNA synthetase
MQKYTLILDLQVFNTYLCENYSFFCHISVMLQISTLRNERERVREGLKKRQLDDTQLALVDEILALDEQRKHAQTQRDATLADINRLSKEIGELMKSGKRPEAEALKSEVATRKEKAAELENSFAEIDQAQENLLITLPNVPHSSVPNGKHADDNEVYQAWDAPLPTLPDGAKPHWELAEQYGIFDLALGVKIAGAGFPVFRGQGARLQRALINFFLDSAHASGYEEVVPPFVVNEASARGTGQLPDKEGQMYYVGIDDLYLIPTAEVPVTNIWRDVIVSEKELPIKATAYTPCFRREAGSYGAHVRGLNRVHQFDKIEIVQIAHPEKSYEILHEMLQHVAKLLDALELPYRILRLCGGDMGFTSALTYDFEVWSAAQGRWLEVSSVSNFETFQTNRLKCRYRDANGKVQLAHSLNGSALALPRIIASLLENHQTADGIKIPAALVHYTGFEWIK